MLGSPVLIRSHQVHLCSAAAAVNQLCCREDKSCPNSSVQFLALGRNVLWVSCWGWDCGWAKNVFVFTWSCFSVSFFFPLFFFFFFKEFTLCPLATCFCSFNVFFFYFPKQLPFFSKDSGEIFLKKKNTICYYETFDCQAEAQVHRSSVMSVTVYTVLWYTAAALTRRKCFLINLTQTLNLCTSDYFTALCIFNSPALLQWEMNRVFLFFFFFPVLLWKCLRAFLIVSATLVSQMNLNRSVSPMRSN